jgi:hypothetical protein
MMQTGSRFGMQLMSHAIQALVASQAIDPAEAERALNVLSDEPHGEEGAGAPRRAQGAAERPGFGFGGLA